MESKMINQSDLTSDCWTIQIWGISHCNTCEFKDTDECGGKRIIKLIKEGEFPINGLPDQREAK